MFLQSVPGIKPVKKIRQVLLQAKPEELDRLHRRALEVLPGIKILPQAQEHYYLGIEVSAEEFSQIKQKFFSQIKNQAPELGEQAFFLRAEDERICLFSQGAPGLYYGMLGLAELFKQEGGIHDFFSCPVYSRRGFLQDLSRGQVLHYAGFERLVEALSEFRYNWLTFNLEHNFGYEKHPEIPGNDDELSRSEAKALFELCREHYLEVVPMQQSLGHCRGILSRSKYQHLAFDEKARWSLDPRKKEVYQLLAELYQEQAECFPGNYFLVGCDEPFDLKKLWKGEAGKSFSQVYLEHLLKLAEILSRLKRRMLVWGDIFVEHPELLTQIPKDIIVVNWQYGTSHQEDENHYLSKSRAFADWGGDFYIATTTWSYARLFPELRTMEANNRHFLKVGQQLGAKGALLTNWGDLGHLQLLGYLVLPIAYFARQSFTGEELSLEELSKRVSLGFFNDPTGNSTQLYLWLNRINEIISPGKFLGSSALFVLLDDLFSTQYFPNRPLSEVSNQLLEIIKEIESRTRELKNPSNPEWLLDLKPIIYALGILFSKFLVQENAPLMFQDLSKREHALSLIGHLSIYFQNFALGLRDRWLTQAKPRGLERNLQRLVKVLEGYQKRLNQIKEGMAQNWEQFQSSPEFAEYRFNLLKELGLEGLL